MTKLNLARITSCFALAALVACGSKDDGGASSQPASKPAPPPPPASPPPPAVTPASEAKVTPKHLPPFEMLSFKQTAQKEANGWPKFDAVNLGDKTIMFASIHGYAYDKGGKLVKRLSVPFSWNAKVPPGEKSMFPVSVGAFEKEPITADTFELCYDSLKFDGDDKFVDDKTLCTESRPKGGVKSKGDDADGASSAAPGGKKGGGHGKKGGKKK